MGGRGVTCRIIRTFPSTERSPTDAGVPNTQVGYWVDVTSPHARMVWRSQFPSLLQKSIWYALTPGDIRDNPRSLFWGWESKDTPIGVGWLGSRNFFTVPGWRKWFPSRNFSIGEEKERSNGVTTLNPTIGGGRIPGPWSPTSCPTEWRCSPAP